MRETARSSFGVAFIQQLISIMHVQINRLTGRDGGERRFSVPYCLCMSGAKTERVSDRMLCGDVGHGAAMRRSEREPMVKKKG